MVNALSAANAYRNQVKMMQDAATDGPVQDASQPSFSRLLEGALQDAVNTQTTSEAAQMSSLTGGKVDLADLVTAVANAELSLNTVVAVRDRVINAYNDIVKMPI